MPERRLSLVLVDDDPEIAQAVVNYLPPERYDVTVVGDGEAVLPTVRAEQPDAVILDVHLPSMSGLELLRSIKAERPQTPVIIISGYVSTDNAIEAMKEGAFEYLAKPFRLAQLAGVLARAIGQAVPAPPLDDEDVPLEREQLLGKSPEIVALAKTIGQVADTDAPVLLLGESGTGKELVARIIHRTSARCRQPFHSVSCQASSPGNLEAELFGQESPASPGSSIPYPGRLEQAGGGTLFIDEVADLSLLAQSRLYRVLEEGVIRRPGTDERIPVNVRIIAASGQSLVDAMKEGRFRVDLYYKSKVATLFLPPLRERKADIRLLADFFIKKYSRLEHRVPKPLSPAAYERMLHHQWPGNVRELENAIHMAVVLSRENELTPEDFPGLAEMAPSIELNLRESHRECVELFARVIAPLFPQLATAAAGRIYGEMTAALEEALVEAALESTGHNQVRAAQLLGIARNTLRERLRRNVVTGGPAPIRATMAGS